jgi:hypothetical protein
MVAIVSGTVYNRCMDDYESPQGVGTSKKGLEVMIEVQPKDTSKGHFYVSLAKSFIRIGAGCWLMTGNLLMAGVCFILAEVLGIVEELV